MDKEKRFEADCEDFYFYLTELAARRYGDCPERDSLVQDSITELFIRLKKGEEIREPKAYLATVLKNKHNIWLREKYRNNISVFEVEDRLAADDDSLSFEEEDLKSEEYERVRREIGRLSRIYREVTVRHYVHGHSVQKIAEDLKISEGTVKSRLSSARVRIKKGINNMKKYSQSSYEPKKATIGIWGGAGLSMEPFSLLASDIEANVLNLAYEKPISVNDLADGMGMPLAYLEPVIDKLIYGELMGKTSGGLVYTRCFVQQYEDSFGNVKAQEEIAKKYASRVWDIIWKHIEPLTYRAEFAVMSEKQKATLVLFLTGQILNEIVQVCRPTYEGEPDTPPERPNAGRWFATLTVYGSDSKKDNKYERSGPVQVGYREDTKGKWLCKLFDCQSVFGDAHWAYGGFRYKCNLSSILRFYASFLDCDVKTDNELLWELIPEFERLNILKRDKDGEIRLDVPALSFGEIGEYWDPATVKIKKELTELLSDELRGLWTATKNKVPKYVDGALHFMHTGAVGAYAIAQLLELTSSGLMPYKAEVGKTPLIFIAYRRNNE